MPLMAYILPHYSLLGNDLDIITIYVITEK